MLSSSIFIPFPEEKRRNLFSLSFYVYFSFPRVLCFLEVLYSSISSLLFFDFLRSFPLLSLISSFWSSYIPQGFHFPFLSSYVHFLCLFSISSLRSFYISQGSHFFSFILSLTFTSFCSFVIFYSSSLFLLNLPLLFLSFMRRPISVFVFLLISFLP